MATFQLVAQTPTNGLLSEYRFNSSAADAGPNAHHGILNGDVGFVTDRFGNPNSAVSFNGGYVELGAAEGLRFSPDNSFTISAWIYVETGSDQGRLYSSEDPTRNIHIVMSQQEIGARIFFYFGSAHIRSLVFEHDAWHHFSFIYDAVNGTSLYWNGELVATDPVINNEYGSVYNTQRFGQQASPSYVPYIGMLDHVVFHSRVLTVQEINQLRQVDDTQAPFNPMANLVAHWPFSGNALNSVSDAMHGEVIRANLSADRFGNMWHHNSASSTRRSTSLRIRSSTKSRFRFPRG
jgi:hypothetical protein